MYRKKLKEINLSTFNIHDTSGVQDYLHYFKKKLKNNFEVNISDTIRDDAINIVIDEFSNPNSVRYLQKRKQENPNLKISIVLTEFFNNKVQTLNSFEFQDKELFDFIYKSANIFIYIKNKIEKFFNSFPFIFCLLFDYLLYVALLFLYILLPVKNQFKSKSYKEYFQYIINKRIRNRTSFAKKKILSSIIYLSYILLFPIILILMIKNGLKFNYIISLFQNNKSLKLRVFISKLRSQVSSIVHFKKRYNGLKDVLKYFDEIFYSHPFISKSIDREVFSIKAKLEKDLIFYPEYVPNFALDGNIFYFSGELTPYRKQIFENFKKKNIHNWSKFTYNLDNVNYATYHIDDHTNKKFSFSLNPKKTMNWPYSSPTRYLRSLEKNEIPIVFDQFDDYTKFMTLYMDLDEFNINEILKNKKDIFIEIKNKLKNLKELNDKFEKELINYYSF